MKIDRSATLEEIQLHLKRLGTGVSLDRDDYPSKLAGSTAQRVLLEPEDADRLVMWFEFKKYTPGESCRVVDVSEALLAQDVRGQKRVKSHMDGDSARGFLPTDLRAARELELVAVSTGSPSDFLLLIDGNHRAIAQQLKAYGFAGVPAFVVSHPDMWRWPYASPVRKLLTP